MRPWQYEIRRNDEITEALRTKAPVPPLLETNYNLVCTWAKKMKQLAGEPQRHGAFNEASSLLSSQMKLVAQSSSSEKELNMETTTAARDLAVMVDAAETSAVYPSPTTAKVKRDMEAMESRRLQLQPAKKKKKGPSTDDTDETQRRKAVAANMRRRHNMEVDEKKSKQRRCQICQ